MARRGGKRRSEARAALTAALVAGIASGGSAARLRGPPEHTASAGGFVASAAAAAGGTLKLHPTPTAADAVTASASASRAAALVAKMTLAEKVSLCTGAPGDYTGNVAAVPRLGVPSFGLNDGPQGIRVDAHPDTSTSFPCGLAVAASFDPEVARDFGTAIATELRAKGGAVWLGPGLNVARFPRNGRNFEYMSGEDPTLGAVMGTAAVLGAQSQKVVATAKHYTQNNQEYQRTSVNEVVDERTHMEMYLPPFEAAIAAGGAAAVMCSYNKVTITGPHSDNVTNWACEHPAALEGYLRGKLGFEGWVMSDWGATHSTEAASAGLDQEMGSEEWFGKKLVAAVGDGSVKEATVDRMATRVLTGLMSVGAYDDPPVGGNVSTNVSTAEHHSLARSAAAAGTVLLKNQDGLLPLLPVSEGGKQDKPLTVAVVGRARDDDSALSGGGSGYVSGAPTVTFLEGLKARARTAGVNIITPKGNTPAEQQAVAAQADVAICILGAWSHEGQDRVSLEVDQIDADTANRVAAHNPMSILVVVTPGAVVVPAADSFAAALAMFMPGQEAGNALADVLFGDVNPSGRLPLTFPHTNDEVPFSEGQYPGVGPDEQHLTATYSEALEIGYRYYHARNLTPAFAFGHGLSYTSFSYAWADGRAVVKKGPAGGGGIGGGEPGPWSFELAVTNSGERAGDEVVQLYLTFPAAAGEPPRQLRAFQKVRGLAAGETRNVTLSLDDRSVSVWDAHASAWALAHGVHRIEVGAASDDLRLVTSLHV